MNRGRGFMALVCALALLAGCTGQAPQAPGATPEGAYAVYFSSQSDRRAVAAVDCEYRTLPQGADPVTALMELLLAGPERSGLTSPFPQSGVRLRSWRQADGQLYLDFSEQYSELSGIDLTVADYCLALTFCQLEGVEAVCVTVEGEELPFRHTQQLRGDDVLLSGAEEMPVYVGVNLWFPRADGGLGVEYRQVVKTEDRTLLEAVLTAWLAGPEREGLLAPPAGTELRSVTLEGGVCAVNLSAPFLESAPADRRQARLLLYAMVNTLGGLEAVDAVQLQVEGVSVPVYGGVPADGPLEPDTSLENRLTNS